MSWTIDYSHSQIQFSAKHMMISNVKGTFAKWEGTLNIDEANPANSSVDISIDASTIDTGVEQRDGHLKSPDFLDVGNFPTITFKSKRVEIASATASEFKIVGDLTIRGTTKEITLTATNEGQAKNPFSGASAWAFTASTKFNRKDWALNWNVALEAGGWLVGEDIKLDIELEAIKEAVLVAQ